MKRTLIAVAAVAVSLFVISQGAFAGAHDTGTRAPARSWRPRPQQTCALVLERFYPENAAHQKRSIAGRRGRLITIGLEGEIGLQRGTPRLPVMEHIAPMAKLYRSGKTDDPKWSKMSPQEQAQATPQSGYGMVLTEWAKTDPNFCKLQDKLTSDPGGAEMKTGIFDTLEHALQFITATEQLFGPSSSGRSRIWWQGNVVGRADSKFVQENRDGLNGYARVTADYAMLRTLTEGHEHRLEKDDFVPGKNLTHKQLGPMTTTNAIQISREISSAIDGRQEPDGDHYILGTYFRSRIYGKGHFGGESRDAMKDVERQKQELRRLTHHFAHGFDGYAPFKILTMLDARHFAQLSPKARFMLSAATSDYAERFAWPMRPFEQEYAAALAMTPKKAASFASLVQHERQKYVERLEEIADLQGGTTRAQRIDQARIAMAEFAHNIGLYPLLDAKFAQIAEAAVSH